MQFLVLLMVVAVLLVSACLADDKYTTQFDTIDIDEILQSDRLLTNYMKCLLETGKCTPAGLELRKNIPDSLASDCVKCSAQQREQTKKVLKFLIENRRNYYDQLEAKYDPNGKYRIRYKETLDKEGIKL